MLVPICVLDPTCVPVPNCSTTEHNVDYVKYGATYYKFHKTKTFFEMAEKICESESGTLVAIENKGKYDFLNFCRV